MNREDNVHPLYIKVTRNDLLQSQSALISLGRVSLPVQRSRYWLAKTIGRINAAVKREMLAAQKESNRLIAIHGEELKDKDGNATGQRGIVQTNVETMQKYHEDMEQFNAEIITIENARQVPLEDMEAAGVSLSIADQASLHWLLKE